MPRNANLAARAETIAAIKHAARAQMIAKGTAGISLRGIARELGMTAPALYNYFPRYDDLITALIVDAFNGFADAVENAIASADKPAEKMRAGARAYRDWALAHPADFQLIYGNPIPGYIAPAEMTVPAAARMSIAFLGVMAQAWRTGHLTPPTALEIPASVRAHIAQAAHHIDVDLADVPLDVIYLLYSVWGRIHGLVMLELFGHTPPVVGDPAAFYEHQLDAIERDIGMTH